MMQKKEGDVQLSYLRIHLAVILFGFTAILGDLIQMSAVMIVWWRVGITSLSLLVLAPVWKRIPMLSRKQLLIYVIIGFLMGLHWISFYGAIKLSNASICLICMSTTSLFTSFVEPLLIKRKLNQMEVVSAAIIVPAMILIVSTLEGGHIYGVIAGLVSALLSAIFSVLNKMYIHETDPYTISFIELSSAWNMISVMLLIMAIGGGFPEVFLPINLENWIYLLILSLACTTLAQILTLQALKHISAFAINMVINLEPVYGILLAALFLNEHQEMNFKFYIGAGIILGTVLLYPYLNRKAKKSSV